jgi:anti-sigma-K factor RskA
MTTNISIAEQELAAGYILGDLNAAERHKFEVILAENLQLQREVDALQQAFHEIPQGLTRVIPPSSLQARLLESFIDLLHIYQTGWQH